MNRQIVHGTRDGSDCGRFTRAATFDCAACGRCCCYCLGGDDVGEAFHSRDLCSDCWNAARMQLELDDLVERLETNESVDDALDHALTTVLDGWSPM